MSILLDKNKHDSNTKMGSTEDSIPLDHDNDESDYAVSPSLQATTKKKKWRTATAPKNSEMFV
jgi:hypothetical protein